MSAKSPICSGCPFEHKGQGFVAPESPGLVNRLIVWGEAPGQEEVRAFPPRAFVGRSGRLLRGLLSRSGFADSELCFRNVVLCRPPGNDFPGQQIAQECLRRHQPEIPEGKHLLLGANAVESLTGLSWRGKRDGGGITDVHGSWLPMRGGQWGVASVHPSFVQRGRDEGAIQQGKSQSEWYPQIARAALKASRGAPTVPYIQPVSGSQLVQFWLWRAEMVGNVEAVEIDVEGRIGDIHLCGYSWAPDHAYVTHWDSDAKRALEWILKDCREQSIPPAFHNGDYDVQVIEHEGVSVPPWDDSIVTAGLLDPSQRMGLQRQALTHLDNSIAWKGLVDHEQGPDYEGPVQLKMRALWTDVLARLGITGPRVPKSSREWYWFYNGLDCAWGLALRNSHMQTLQKQGRLAYYYNIARRIQRPLVAMSEGFLCDETKLERHRTACQRLVRMGTRILRASGKAALLAMYQEAEQVVCDLVELRQAELEDFQLGRPPFSKAAELDKARSRARSAKAILAEGFNPESNKQKGMLLCQWYGIALPETDSGNLEVNEDVLTTRLSQLKRGTIKPRKQFTVEEVVRVIQAMLAVKKWATWERNFLSPDQAEPDEDSVPF